MVCLLGIFGECGVEIPLSPSFILSGAFLIIVLFIIIIFRCRKHKNGGKEKDGN